MPLDFPIVDAHQHFWDPRVNYYPWLCDEHPIAFRYGNYAAIRKPYLPKDYLDSARPIEIAKTVYIEAEWNPQDPLGEMNYIETLRRESGFPSVAIAQAWLDREDCPVTLEALAAKSFVRGIRHKPRANKLPSTGGPSGMSDSNWRQGYAQLASHGLHFELQTPWWHLHEASRLASDFPNTLIVLNHTGLPSDRSDQGLTLWKQAMKTLAAQPNVAVKISGLGQANVPWSISANRDIVLTTIEIFGVERAMFASNFPVDSLCGSFATIFNGFDAIVSELCDADRRALFHDNALRIYRISEGHLNRDQMSTP